ncbi:MAG: O-antigen ligase family protein [Candidatus Azambacteria bacterium]|nr:O-antigen ligase family protein [Candidatus Azambacteria bacterium]
MFKLEFYLSKIVRYGLYAVLLTPLAFWPKALFPFLTPKFILFQVLMEIVFAAWLALLALRNTNTRMNTNNTNQNSRHSYDNSYHSYWRNWLIISLFLFIAASFVSASFGIDFSRSFWGLGARMTGLFAELHFFAWFLMLVSTFSNTNTRINTNNTNNNSRHSYAFINSYYYINFSFFVALTVAATAFYQNPKWVLSLGYGIFNNPTFVAPYLIFHFFWGLYNVRNRVSNIKSWFYGVGSAFILFVILLGQIRGAVLGLLVGIFALGIGLIFSNILNRRSRIILSAFYIFLIVGIASFWYLRDNPAVSKFSPIKRVTGISLQETTVQTRLLAWQVALKGFGDKSFFGTGPENFNYIFNKYYNPKFLKFGGGGFGETWFDKPHNAFLEILTETGIIGGLAYIFIWAVAVMALFKLFKSGQKLLSLILLSSLVAYFGTVFFSFDSFGSWFGLYLFLAFIAASLSNTNDANYHANDTNKSFLKNIFALFVCVGLFVLLYVNYSIWRANIANADALRIFGKNSDESIVLFKKSQNYFTPYKAEYQFDLIASIAGALQKNIQLPNPEETINFALEAADKAVVSHPANAAYYTDLVKIYNILGGLGRDPQILAQAEAFGKTALELSPNRQETLYYLAQTALLKGDAKQAVNLAKEAVDAEPSIRQSHWYFGLALIADGQKKEGMAEIKKALDMGYKPQNQSETDFIKNLKL